MFRKTLMAAAASLAMAPAIAQDMMAEDPFIWLEEARSDEAMAWVEAENEKTESVLLADPRFEELRAEAYAIATDQRRIPSVAITPYGLRNRWQDDANPKGLIRLTTLESYRTDDPEWEVVLDIDKLAADEGRDWNYAGFTCLEPEGRYCLLGLSDGGKDANVFREFDMETRQFVENGFFFDEDRQWMEWVDKDTLLVTRNWGEGSLTESNYPFITKMVKRGQSFDEAVEVFRGEASDVSAGAGVLRDWDGNVLGYTAQRGLSFHESAQYWQQDGEWVRLDLPAKASFFGPIDGRMIVSLREPWGEFPNDALLHASLENFLADPNGVDWELMWAPEKGQTRSSVGATRDAFYLNVLEDVQGKAYRYTYSDGAWERSLIDLPENATLGFGSSSDTDDELIMYSSGFLAPTTYYYYDGDKDKLEVLKRSPSQFDADGLIAEQHFATSRDGTRIPYFVVRHEDTVMDGSTPTLFYGYGGFQASMLPSYLGTTGKLWLERGGAYILGNMRGGGEYGPDWHQAAIRENKQKTWDDYIAIAEDAIASGLTSPEHLGIEGGSQGGLLVGTGFTQRPDLFGAAIVAVPLFDMMRYHEIGKGASWIGEYGDPRIPEQRAWIEGYSPYQKLVPGAEFPKVLYYASTADDRTHPAHARKAAARMSANGQPYYYYEETAGGHSGGKDPEAESKLTALRYVYLMQELMDD
ncbi:prolyl oligopeptidase family serine peptidase [Sphingomicrobium arenosum]|uniref:prolyl oligopeptidase family serine peptidase n=1 Tax=Sphingomicrobium arenosum TaxID=2233861 RepID=UPI00223EF4D6|nr:prolyl oligopeptidase family serine peptidase [Sphingomicrobium arenosum]